MSQGRHCPDCEVTMNSVRLQTPDGFELRADTGGRPMVAAVVVACPNCGLVRLYLPDNDTAHEGHDGMEV
jgi:hypothetical protein